MQSNNVTTLPWQPHGVFAAALTPMYEDFSVNDGLFIEHCLWLLEQGANGIAVFGTTGEANSLSVAEKMNALDALMAGGIPPERLIVGTGCCAIPDTVTLTRHAMQYGVGGILMLPPFYYKGVSDDGIFASYAEVIERLGDESLRLYLYHFPRMSAVPLTMPLIERLMATFPVQIAGIKDSSGDWQNMKTMVARFPGFRVFAGTEVFLLDILREGGAGCISATVNVTAPLAGRVFHAWKNNEGEDLQTLLTSVRLAMQSYSFIPALKGLMEQFSGNRAWNNMRPPHLPASRDEMDKLQRELSQLGFSMEPVM